MSIISQVVKNRTISYSSDACPIYKVDGFDGYNFSELGVTDQFLENADEYFQKYTNPSHFNSLYNVALREMNFSHKKTIDILDIGTGGGNSIFALSELLGAERMRALGVDISPQLLALLWQKCIF